MKLFTVIICLLIIGQVFSQNVGIGTAAPTEKLDVNGNVNIQGNLKVNGNSGQPGQVLSVNNDGTQSWAERFGYKNRVEFVTHGVFTVPANVREIMIEAIGGGGGGAKGGGGGGAVYTTGIYKVAPLAGITITIGAGGSGAATESGIGTNGGFTNVTGTGIAMSAGGGELAYYDEPGIGGYSFSIIGDSIIYRRVYNGGDGSATTENYSAMSATEYVTMRTYGNGGVCMYNPYAVRKAGFYSFNTVTLTPVKLYYTPRGINHGTGGGGGQTVLGAWGANGTSGKVIISW